MSNFADPNNIYVVEFYDDDPEDTIKYYITNKEYYIVEVNKENYYILDDIDDDDERYICLEDFYIMHGVNRQNTKVYKLIT